MTVALMIDIYIYVPTHTLLHISQITDNTYNVTVNKCMSHDAMNSSHIASCRGAIRILFQTVQWSILNPDFVMQRKQIKISLRSHENFLLPLRFFFLLFVSATHSRRFGTICLLKFPRVPLSFLRQSRCIPVVKVPRRCASLQVHDKIGIFLIISGQALLD